MAKKLNWIEYYFGHCFRTGWREIWNNFKMWRDLISGNYADYAVSKTDDPYEECYQWFWCSINMDETYPKEFLDYLHQLVEDIDTGKQKTYSLDEVMEELRDSLESDHFASQMDLDDVGYPYEKSHCQTKVQQSKEPSC